MIPGPFDIELYRGDIYELFFRVRDEIFNASSGLWEPGDYTDLTGFTAKSQIRATKGATEVAAEFTCTVAADQVASPGSVLCVLTPTQTAALSLETYVWDIQIEETANPANIETYMAGKVTVTGDVTRV